MRDAGPSRTALAVAMSRALHQTLDRPLVFADPLAVRILGERGRAAMAERQESRLLGPILRATLAVRSRVAEDTLQEAVAAGVRQYVVLGAGLDTFGLRNQNPELQVIEVDHPNTQEWKRKVIQAEGLSVPPNLHFVPVDFTRQDLATELRRAGLLEDDPTFFSWLGVVHYLEPAAIRRTLATVARLSGASGGIVFDFLAPPRPWQLLLRLIRWQRGRRVARLGEPFSEPLHPDDARRWLLEEGFAEVQVLGPERLTEQYLSGRSDRLRMSPLAYIALAGGRRSAPMGSESQGG
jgi:methyltransferase (TIGR00027 family)